MWLEGIFLELIFSLVNIELKLADKLKSLLVLAVFSITVKTAKAIDFNYISLNSTCLYDQFDI